MRMYKKRRDITLGEMQDECIRVGGICREIRDIVQDCKYLKICPFQLPTRKACGWNLADPPRFDEAQMAFWRGWYAVGARFVKRRFGTGCVDFSLTTKDFCVSNPCVLPNDIAIQLEEGKVYDLADLFGEKKDGT